MAPKKTGRATGKKVKDLRPAANGKKVVGGRRFPTRHQANIKFGDIT